MTHNADGSYNHTLWNSTSLLLTVMFYYVIKFIICYKPLHFLLLAPSWCCAMFCLAFLVHMLCLKMDNRSVKIDFVCLTSGFVDDQCLIETFTFLFMKLFLFKSCKSLILPHFWCSIQSCYILSKAMTSDSLMTVDMA